MVQTSDGFLWLGTEAGLARFDGYQFRVFDRENTPGLAGDDIRCLFEDRLGALWVGTASGLTRLKDGRARTFTPADGVPSGAVSIIQQSRDDRVWVVTSGGGAATAATESDPAKITFHTFSGADGLAGSVLSLAPDAEEGMWIGTSHGLIHIIGTRIESGPAAIAAISMDALANTPGDSGALLIASSEGVMRLKSGVLSTLAKHESLPATAIRTLIATKEGVWAMGRNSVSLIQPTGVVTFATGLELPGTQMVTIAEDRRGAVWIGTNGGLARFSNGKIEIAAKASPADSAAVLSFLEDREGDMWVGTETAGVMVLRPRAFDVLQASAGKAATSVVQTGDGTVWVGTNGAGLTRISGVPAAARTYTIKDGLASDNVFALGVDRLHREDLWVGTPDGLSLFHAGRWKTFTSAEGLGDDLVRSVLVARDGAAWIGTRHGATRWLDGHGTTLTTAQGLGSDLVGPMLEDEAGDIWLGTSGGLSRLQAGAVKNYGVADGLPSNTISALEASAGGGFWVGTNGQGLARWDGSKFLSFAESRGIPQAIYGLLDDGHGSLWMSSDRGIFRVQIADLQKFRAGQESEVAVSAYGTADGLPSVESTGVGYPSAWRLNDGRLVFATRRGVIVVQPFAAPWNEAPPRVAVEQITVDDRSVTPEAMKTLAPGPSHFSFSFAGINLAAPQRVQYRYMVEGLDRTWIDGDTRRVAYYTNIPYGHYRFLVCARNAGGAWSPAATLPFELRPYFYQTAWFKTLLAVLFGALGFGLYRLRVRTLQSSFDAVTAERNRLAREIHDTLAQSFVAVSVGLEVMSQMLRTTAGAEACREQLDRTRALAREGLQEARRSIWDLRSEGANAQSLPAKLARLLRDAMPRIADAQLETTGTYRSLDHSVEDELYGIAKEAVTNVIRHADATSLRLRLIYDLNSVSLEVVDNGRGFDVEHAPSRDGGHFGLTGLRERGRILGAEVMLESAADQGTRVRVNVPLQGSNPGKRKRI
jgi:ligand-binding sensor domain-containing protein/two-component sensor histidine kinase